MVRVPWINEQIERAAILNRSVPNEVSSSEPVDYEVSTCTSIPGDVERQFQELITIAREGSLDATGEILASFTDYLRIVASAELCSRSLNYPHPSDMVQLAQMEGLKGFASFRGSSYVQLRGWLKQILINNIIDAQRSAIRVSSSAGTIDPAIWGSMVRSAGDSPGNDPSPSSQFARGERELYLHSMLSMLSPRYQEVIRRHHFQGESLEEIAASWRSSKDSVRKVWMRAIGKLRDKMRPNS